MVDTTVRVAVRDAAGERVFAAVRDAADEGVRVVETGPTGTPALAPLVLRTSGGETALYPSCTPAAARALLGDGNGGGEVGEADAPDPAWVVAHGDEEPTALPTPPDGPLSVGTRRVLARCGWVAPAEPPTPRLNDPGAVEAAVRRIGLLGRGRGDVARDAPVSEAWTTARDADGDPVVVVNGNETDERVAGDRLLLASDPGAVLDAAAALARLVDAADVVVTLPEGRDRAAGAVERAIAARSWASSPTPEVVSAPENYLAAEPTMALESLEGNDRLEARLRPPGPEEHGLYGRPTLVHTPRTLAAVRALSLAPGGFDADAADPGTRVVTAGGDVAAPATVELPTAGTLEPTRAAVDLDDGVGFACVGGRFGGLTESLSVGASAAALDAAGLGTEGAVEFHARGACPVAVAGKRSRLAAEENCGRCVPCREGSVQLTDLLRDVYGGTFDDAAIRELARTMRTSSTCDFGRDATRPATTAVQRFETDFAAHADGRCPAGACSVERGGR